MIKLILLFLIFTCLITAKPVTKNAKLVSVAIEHTNPSMGPHEKITTYTLDVVKDQTSANKLLNESKINNLVTLRKYIEAELLRDYTLLNKVRDAGNDRDLPSGGTISHLHLHFEAYSVTIRDLRVMSITGYYTKTFLPKLIQLGSKHVSSSNLDGPNPNIPNSKVPVNDNTNIDDNIE